ncbi:MAG: ferrous iron transport protein A [Phycisphaerae bacterium]|nr:ferrous iron transport protein A [Phycisphaerae bacterium]
MSLAGVSLATRFRVTGVRSGSPLSYRLMEMGLIEGAEVQVVRRAPLGDPLQVRLGDYELSLRTSEAELIDVAAV